MREIKFRVWNKESVPKMEYINMYWFEEQGYRKWDGEDKYTFLMQYTGLKDKNGKEIYEGDIVSFKTGKGEVIWDNGSVGFVVENEYMSVVRFEEIEIIGNIYENPELLRGV